MTTTPDLEGSAAPYWVSDLARSNLTPEDVNGREVSPSELAACKVPLGTSGYVLPYYGLDGRLKPFYRLRLFGKDIKYIQPAGTINHVYFPLRLANTLLKPRKPVLIITEGEKKSSAAVKYGYPAVGLGGVDSWRNRAIILPDSVKLTKTPNGNIRAKLSANDEISEHIQIDDLAEGLEELITYIAEHKELCVLIVFDSDNAAGVKPEVQRAAARLAGELRYKGIATARIRQLILPIGNESKMGLDDYLVTQGVESFDKLVDSVLAKRNAFPRHPLPKGYIATRLQQGNLTRKDQQDTAMSILMELDARGRRLREEATGDLYFFDEDTCRLIPVMFPQTGEGEYFSSPFGTYLYQEFGLASSDKKVLTWLAAQFAGEAPVEDVKPRRVLSPVPTNPWAVAYQISDSQFAIINADPKRAIEFVSNGSQSILFEQGHVAPMDVGKLVEAFQEVQKQPLEPWWRDVIGTVKVRQGAAMETLAYLLPYLSPWLNQWHGVQLPIEIITGEAGSGKSSLYNLRLSILTGKPVLRNAPTDLRDWHASVANTGGLHVTDNVQFTNKELRQRLSDEMCRIVTAPEPYIEMRKLFTTSAQSRIAVQTTFAVTAIQRPFVAVDLLQRSAMIELDPITEAKDGNWVEHAMNNRGGREMWVAHHMYVLHLLLKLAKEKWTSNYKARNRLALYEQCLNLLCQVFGIPFADILPIMEGTAEATATEEDWALSGLKDFANHTPTGSRFTASDIARWCEANEDYCQNPQLTNAFRLGRYLNAHANLVERASGIKSSGMMGGRKSFIVVKLGDKK